MCKIKSSFTQIFRCRRKKCKYNVFRQRSVSISFTATALKIVNDIVLSNKVIEDELVVNATNSSYSNIQKVFTIIVNSNCDSDTKYTCLLILKTFEKL